jgi:hypothetical protein
VGELDNLRPPGGQIGVLMGPPGPVVRRAAVDGHLSRHRRGRPPDAVGNGRERQSRQKPEADLLSFSQLQPSRAGEPLIRTSGDHRSALEHGHHTGSRASDLPRRLPQGEPSTSQTVDCSLLLNGQMWGHFSFLGESMQRHRLTKELQ